ALIQNDRIVVTSSWGIALRHQCYSEMVFSETIRRLLTVSLRPERKPMIDQGYDVILIGGGPAGSCASAILAEYGHRVLVLEREKFPRYHIGESLIPFTFGPLERLGMIPKMRGSNFVKKYSATFVQPNG